MSFHLDDELVRSDLGLRYRKDVDADANITERTNSLYRRTVGEARHPLLFLVMECARPLAGGMRLALAGVDEIVIGRADGRRVERTRVDGKTVLRVGVPDRRMSGDHARIVFGEGGILVEDLSSTNGTVLDGENVQRASITDGAILELGQTLFVYAEVSERTTWRATDLDCEAAGSPEAGFATLDPAYATKLDRLRRVAASGVSLMLLGETGTGKEVLARAVHALSLRPGPFVAINCGAIPATLVESQLFGHMKGSFSGALRDEPGLVRSAHTGTLFLDEIGDLPAPSQAALLRVLQDREVMPLGATRATKVDIRVMCATHKPLDDLMESGHFRRDLFGRLAGFAHVLPPLRDRRVDVGLLVSALLRSGKVEDGGTLRFRSDVARAMVRYDWPLNVRELEQCLLTSAVLAEDGLVCIEDLPPAIGDPGRVSTRMLDGAYALPTRAEALRLELVQRLQDTNGNLSEVARAMGKARQQVQRWVKRFGIDPNTFKRR